MDNINLYVRIISEVFWKIIFTEDELIKSSIKTKLFDDLIDLEKLRKIQRLNNHFQINTPTGKLLKNYQLKTHSLMGALVPIFFFRFTNQG